MPATMLSPSFSAPFLQSGPDPQEVSGSSFSTSPSTSISTSTSTYGFNAGMQGVTPSAKMLSAPVRHPPIPFVSARARVAEFERLREEIRKTEMVRERQVEMLHVLANEASCELDGPQFDGPPIPTASIPIPQSVYRSFQEPIPTAGVPINGSFHLQVDHFTQYQEVYPVPMPTFMPTSMTVPMQIPYHRHQRHQLPYPHGYDVEPPGLVARGRVSQACENCKFRKVKCSGAYPCGRCADRALRCVYGKRRMRGPTKKRRETRGAAVQQVSSSSPTPPPQLDTAALPVRAPMPAPPLAQPQPQLPAPLPLPPRSSSRSTLLSAVPSLSRPLFSPPTPAEPTLLCASGQITRPTVIPPQNDVTQPSPPESLQSSDSSPSRSSPIKSASPERLSDEEIRMTLKMPSDPSGSPDGFFAFLDPPQEVPPPDDAYLLPDPSPNFDFIMDLEADLDSSFEVLGGEVIENSRESEPTPVVEAKSSVPPTRPVSTRAPSMPTIFEEGEQEEEGDLTITPSDAQKALLPPDRFARPPSAPHLVGAGDASQDTGFDSLATPRPHAQTNTFSVPAPDVFDASFEGEVGNSQDFQDSFGQFDFLSASTANQPPNPDFDSSIDVDISAWNEAVFGESPSQESTPSSSSSPWELASEGGPSTAMDVGTSVDMRLQFPSVCGDGISMPTEDEFLRAVMEAVQSSPKPSPAQDGFEMFWDASRFDL